MAYSIMKESKVLVLFEGRTYLFDALANFSFETGMTEFKRNRKTVHNKSNYPLSRVTGRNPVTLSLTINFTVGSLESMFFEWMGMERSSNTLALPYTSGVEPTYIDIFIIYPNNIFYHLKHSFVTNADFTLEKGVPELSVGVEGSEIVKVTQIPPYSSIQQGEVQMYSPLVTTIGREVLPSVQGAGISFQQQCSWRNSRSIHDIGTLYSESKAIIDEMNFSANVTGYSRHISSLGGFLTDSNEPILDLPISIYNENILVDIPSARVTKRLTSGEVNTVGYDIIPNHDTPDPVTITFK